MGQLLLIPDPRPLDERLGGKFFREAPKRPGVYLMRDAADKLLYVGKAKSIRQRLQNYRTANPDRMPRRHLRMLREVARVEFQLCPSEAAALKHEAELLRSLKPKFNRAGVWPGKPGFIAWHVDGEQLNLTVVEIPAAGWQRYGPLGGSAFHLQQTISRLLWLAMNPERPLTDLPAGWAHGEFMETTAIKCGCAVGEVLAALDKLFWQETDEFLTWLGAKFARRTHAFERRVIEQELECLKEFGTRKKSVERGMQLALL